LKNLFRGNRIAIFDFTSMLIKYLGFLFEIDVVGKNDSHAENQS